MGRMKDLTIMADEGQSERVYRVSELHLERRYTRTTGTYHGVC